MWYCREISFITPLNVYITQVGAEGHLSFAQTYTAVTFTCKTKLSMVIAEGLAQPSTGVLAQPWTVGGVYASPNLNMLNSIKPWYYFNNRNGWRLKGLCFPSIELISRFSISDAFFPPTLSFFNILIPCRKTGCALLLTFPSLTPTICSSVSLHAILQIAGLTHTAAAYLATQIITITHQ